jgi:uncharacterized protein (TIGR01319 family)
VKIHTTVHQFRKAAVCADVGSTFTKVAVVDLDSGDLLATASHPTTVDTDVLHGLDAAVERAVEKTDAQVHQTYVCSSAGGGLRLAVVGYESLVTAEAGHRVGLSAGARVVHVAAGRLDTEGVRALREQRPDVVLLVGGTDGGDADVLRHNADRLARSRLRLPVVLAGNVDVRDEVADLLARGGARVVQTDNVLPRIGVLNAGPARAAIREVFLRHVIGGKRLSTGPRFASLVRGATPDVVLTAVELLADLLAADLLVVDVGGATTDVYSVREPVDSTDVAGTLWRSRTVEGDLGLRWNAPSVLAAAVAERLLTDTEKEALAGPAQERADNPGFTSHNDADRSIDATIARLAATVALRRHARGDTVRTSGATVGSPRVSAMDLRQVRLLVGSGGVLRHGVDGGHGVLEAVLNDHGGGWALPRAADAVLDRDYVLAPAGLLAADHPHAAKALLRRLIAAAPSR